MRLPNIETHDSKHHMVKDLSQDEVWQTDCQSQFWRSLLYQDRLRVSNLPHDSGCHRHEFNKRGTSLRGEEVMQLNIKKLFSEKITIPLIVILLILTIIVAIIKY